MNVQPFLFGSGWIEVKDGNDTGRALFDRHYSRKRHVGRKPLIYIGPGRKIVLISACARAVFAWRWSVHRQDGQEGVECAIFRNEGAGLSSSMILHAELIAQRRWPDTHRFFTFVKPDAVQSVNPGYCFKMAGWRFCGMTKTGLHILEKLVTSTAERNDKCLNMISTGSPEISAPQAPRSILAATK